MIRLVTVMAAAATLATSAAARADEPVTVEVFVSAEDEFEVPRQWSALEGRDYRLVVFEVDGFETIERELSQGLPADAERAQAIVEARLAAGGGALQQRMQRTGVGLERALQMKINEYPAIVFGEGEAVVYGETDLLAAVRAFEQSRGR